MQIYTYDSQGTTTPRALTGTYVYRVLHNEEMESVEKESARGMRYEEKDGERRGERQRGALSIDGDGFYLLPLTPSGR